MGEHGIVHREIEWVCHPHVDFRRVDLVIKADKHAELTEVLGAVLIRLDPSCVPPATQGLSRETRDAWVSFRSKLLSVA